MEMKTKWFVRLSLLVLGVLALVALVIVAWQLTSALGEPVAVPPPSSAAVPRLNPEYWPTDGWQSRPPEELGFDSDKLAEMLLVAREQNIQIHSFLLIRHGFVL